MTKTKTCTICRTTKPLSDYRSSKRAKDGLKGHCNGCIAKRGIEARRKKRVSDNYQLIGWRNCLERGAITYSSRGAWL